MAGRGQWEEVGPGLLSVGSWCPGEAPLVLFWVALSWSWGFLSQRKKGAWKQTSTTRSRHPQPTEPSVTFCVRRTLLSAGETEGGHALMCSESQRHFLSRQAELGVLVLGRGRMRRV